MASFRDAVVLVVVGLVFSGIGGYLYVDEQRAIDNSEPIEGVVVDSSVYVDRATSSDDSDSYFPEIRYRYSYDGREYTNDNVFPGTGSRSTSRARANSLVDEYRPGATVTVYVEPDTPERSFLIKERATLFHLAFGGAGVLMVLAGIGSFFRRVFGFL